MKTLLASLLMACAPAMVLAQADAPAKAVAKTAATKPAATKIAKAKPKPSASRVELKSAAANVAAGVSAAEAALSPTELALSERVQTGRMPCELGAYVTVSADARMPGYFDVEGKGFKFRMAPVESRTGAIRLEDPKAGAVWLQIANKSMLMNQKLGQRMADECMSPQQALVAEGFKTNPPPSLLETAAITTK
ncbi:hypothetical protein PY257_01410 [Ramlibacter sp. H39-3-26]|uniref:hypothetical protein n=1 Tax=Curvibacter soli TaxID=3031331 RepID=UPI0023DC03D4|nr:hypothetical protein [Ramlibacter sp. H39-3-26]MDF1483856.1 hypothetical protein [Ramlibacter sp. H39-3-26]